MACNALNVTWSVQKCSSGLFFYERWSGKDPQLFLLFWKEIYKAMRSWVFTHFYTFHFGICEYNTQFLECNVTTLFRSCSSLCFSHPHIYHGYTVESLRGVAPSMSWRCGICRCSLLRSPVMLGSFEPDSQSPNPTISGTKKPKLFSLLISGFVALLHFNICSTCPSSLLVEITSDLLL